MAGAAYEPEIREVTVEAGKTYMAAGSYSQRQCSQTSYDPRGIPYCSQMVETWSVDVGEADPK
jgi:hypothetical protein